MQKVALLFTLFLALVAFTSAQYMAPNDGAQAPETPVGVNGDQETLDYYDLVLANLLNGKVISANEKRSCIRRGGPCDHRPNDCCPKSSCRCNLWGTNCRCARLGLFQKWGK